MTNYTSSSLRLAAASLPPMTPAQEATAWRQLFKSADTATRTAMASIAHSIVAAPTTDNNTPKPPPFGAAESGTNRGRLRGLVLPVGCVGEVGVPASVVVGEGVVEYPGADLEQ